MARRMPWVLRLQIVGSDELGFGRVEGGYQKGVTLIELLVATAVLAILAAIAVPYYGDYVERQRWEGATEAVYSMVLQAKRASISNNQDVYFVAYGLNTSSWCATFSETSSAVASADCSAGYVNTPANSSVRINSSSYPNIVLLSSISGSASIIGFEMPGITVDSPQTLTLRSSRLGDIDVVLSSTMQVYVCSDDLSRYPDC